MKLALFLYVNIHLIILNPFEPRKSSFVSVLQIPNPRTKRKLRHFFIKTKTKGKKKKKRAERIKKTNYKEKEEKEAC